MQEVQLLKSGKYEFYVTGVVSNNKEGNPFKTKDGYPYKKLKISMIDKEGFNQFIYDIVFDDNLEKIKQIIQSVGCDELTQKFETGKLDLKDFVGRGGYCIVGIQKGRDNYPPENIIECYLHGEYQYLMPNLCASSKEKEINQNLRQPNFVETSETIFNDYSPF